MPSLAVFHQMLTGQLRRVRQQVADVAVPGYNHSVDETVGAPGRQEGSTPHPSFILKISNSGASKVCRVGCPELAK